MLGQESWDEVERRNQLLVRALARRHPRTRFLFAEIPFRPREARAWAVPRLRQVESNIWVVRAIRPVPDRVDDLADRAEAAQIRRALRQLGIERPLVWTQDSRAADIIGHLAAGPVVFDLTDDWAAFERTPAAREAMQRRIEGLGRRAEVVFACSRSLELGARSWAPRLVYLPNAVEAPHTVQAEPPELAHLPRPRLGYVGTLHSSRLDVPLLAEAASARPSWSFVLLGPDMLDPGDRRALAALANVHHLGVRPHDQVQAYLQHLDVCLIPHRVTDFTRSLDPLKLYEYLAAGRPVVATPVGNAPELAAEVRIAATAAELVGQAEQAVAEDCDEQRSTRRQLMAGETWEARAAQVEEAMEWPDPALRRPGVTVAVVSFNTCELLRRCLVSIAEEGTPGVRTVVVDNASSDGSPEMVRAEFPDVELIETGENAGFAKANNLAFERCNTEFFLLLNSDAFVPPGGIRSLLDVAVSHPRAGAVGPRLLNEDGTLQRSAWPFPEAWRLLLEAFAIHWPLRRLGLLEDLGTWSHDSERTVDFLIGACLLLRSSAFAEVGGFDEAFWLYGEEADLQKRLSTRGWDVVFTPAAEVVHVGGASSTIPATRLSHFYGGQRRFLRKHGGPAAWPLGRLALLVGSLLRARWSAARFAVGSPAEQVASSRPTVDGESVSPPAHADEPMSPS